MSGNEILEIPCLGKPFELGMLYDCRNEHLVSGIKLWDASTLSNAFVSRPLPKSEYQVYTNDSLDAKMEMVEADDNFKLSFLSGMTDEPNYVDFLNDTVSSKQQARVTMKHSRTSRFEEVGINLLESTNHNDVDTRNVTHFVSGVLYGCNTYIVFDREVGCNETMGLVTSDMKVLISSLANTTSNMTGLASILEMDKEVTKKLICSVYGDKTQTSPKTINSYEEVAMSLRAHEKNDEIREVVPIKACLHPLRCLDIPAAIFTYEISLDTIAQIQNVMDNLGKFTRLNDLTKTNAYSNFSSIQEKVLKFKEMASLFEKTLQRKLSSLVPQVRGRKLDVKELTALLKTISRTPFHQPYLSSWVSGIEKEVMLLSMYLDYFKDIQFTFKAEERQSVISSLEYERVVCFSFMLGGHDSQLQEMYSYLHNGTWNQECLKENHWYNNDDIVRHIKTLVRNFKSTANTNNDEKIEFIVTNINNKGKGDQVAAIQVFEHGQLTHSQLSENNARASSSNQLQSVSDDEPKTPIAHVKPLNRIGKKQNSSRLSAAHSLDSGLTVVGKQEEPKQTSKLKKWFFDRTGWSKIKLKMKKKHPDYPARSESRNTSEMESLRSSLPPYSCQSQITEKEHFSGNSFLEVSALSPESEVNKLSFRVQPGEINQIPGRSPLIDQVVNKWQETNEQAGTKSDSSLPLEECTSITQPPAGSRRNEYQFPSSESPAIEDTKKPEVVHNNSSHLAHRMRLHSEEIKRGDEEFVEAVHKLPMEETMRIEGKMVIRKSLKYQFDGKQLPTNEVSPEEKVLLVIGATGAGKSTLINGMVNYIMGVEWEDEFRFKLVSEEVSSQADSVTKEITAYTIHPMEGSNIPYKFTIIDTPGFGDTKGLSRDIFITSQIQALFSLKPPHGIDHLDGVGFVTQASLPRLTPTQKYIFDSILSIFGKDVENNFFMMITFSDGKSPPVLEAIKKAQISYQSYFKFNNSALFAKNTNDGDGSDTFDKMFWEMGVNSFNNFFGQFKTATSVSLQLTNEVLKEREQLEALVEGLNPKIKLGFAKIEEMRQDKCILQQHEADIEHSKKFEFYVDVMKSKTTDLKGTGRHTTTCLKCNYTCHTDCKIPNDDEKNRCLVMDQDGHCTVCTGKCSWDQHKNCPYLIEFNMVKEKRTSADLRKKYNTAVSGKSSVEDMLQKLETDLYQLRINVLSDMYQVRICLCRLDEIALRPNPLTEVQYVELLIENEKRKGEPGWMDRVKAFEDVKKKAKMFTKIKNEKDLPKLLDEFIPMEQQSNASKKIQSRTAPEMNDSGCVVQ